MIALIDGDIVAYRCAASAEDEDESIAILRTDILMRDILTATNSVKYQTFLSDVSTFRHKIFPFYKANRTQPRPIHLKACKTFLEQEWSAKVMPDLEADDCLGISQSNETIICSIDKDLLQVPGEHYNFVRQDFYSVTEQSGRYSFWYQMLVGDRTDNIDGVKGIGDKKAKRILEGCTTDDQYFDTVRNVYNDDDLMYLNGRLLWILREAGGIWNPPQIEKMSIGQDPYKQEAEAVLDSMGTLMSTE